MTISDIKSCNSMKLPVTVLIAAKNEEANIHRTLASLGPAEKVYLLDSNSTDRTVEIALQHRAEVVQFNYNGKHPKKRQWGIDNLPIHTEWLFLLDADEVVPDELWQEIQATLEAPQNDAYLILKGFHFMGRRFKWGGFSHAAVLLFKTGKVRFERIVDEADNEMDMEVHERVLVDGSVGRLNTPLIHEDFKGLDAYKKKHDEYSAWEARARLNFLKTGAWGEDGIEAKLTGNVQERRRFLKSVIIRVPFEPVFWFIYHYILRLGFLEGKAGFIASSVRAKYIANVRKTLRSLSVGK